ncbi:cytochrome b N-terminal domain-containing protein [Falsirhodobacter sp. alg1]|uniref:cytochrome b n=1 Tax=Falsirhodobacter sp. alg1 TaxID=1472418 RepID=UPI000788A6FE|nr:cytochrome b N-terminal domain-containing protein [Falsirhodobacter sp. alg1]
MEPYRPKSAAARWLQSRLPLPGIIHHLFAARTPRNLNWMWVWGIILVFCLGLQIVTGAVLAFHYTPQTELAFASIQRIVRNVNGGALLQSLHANGASLFFIAIYFHIFRSIYYGSHKPPREVTWLIGMTMYLVLMTVAFMGYVLPWGSMGVGAATVVTGMFGTIPWVGDALQAWVLGGPSVGNATLNRFAVLHYLLPMVALGLMALHIWSVHVSGNSNPDGVEPRQDPEGNARDTLPFWPYFVLKDLLALVLVLVIFFAVATFGPDTFAHPENFVEAGGPITDAAPEWYFLPFYAILRSITPDLWPVQALHWISGGLLDAAFLGVLALFASVLVLMFLPWLDRSPVRSARYRPVFRVAALLLAADFVMLGWCGAGSGEGPWGLIGTLYWFGFFLVILPVLSRRERTRALPETIGRA